MVITVTYPEAVVNEQRTINELLACGLEKLHVKKDGLNEEGMKRWLEQIKPEYRNKLALHSMHHLAATFGITQLHFPEWQWKKKLPELTLKNAILHSASAHHSSDLEKLNTGFCYAFLGPQYPSISKEGYAAPENQISLERTPYKPLKVIAIGGIDNKEKIEKLKLMGFDGIALLGAIWMQGEKPLEQFKKMSALWNN